MQRVYVLYTIMYTYVCIRAAVGVLWFGAAGLEGLIRLRLRRQAYVGRSIKGLVASSLRLVFIGA